MINCIIAIIIRKDCFMGQIKENMIVFYILAKHVKSMVSEDLKHYALLPDMTKCKLNDIKRKGSIKNGQRDMGIK